jgi:HlyD family secretion protein
LKKYKGFSRILKNLKMKNKKLLKILAIVVIALILITIIGKKSGMFGDNYVTKVSTEFPEEREIIELITGNGKIQPQTEVKISADVSGEIIELYVNEGDYVFEGDILLKINPDLYLSSIDQMNAALNSAKANLANSKAMQSQVKAQFTKTELSYNRNSTLYTEGAISKSDYETIEAEYEIAKAEVEASEQSVLGAKYNVMSAEATLKEAMENLNKTTIYAPIEGTVSSLNVEKGERVVGTIQMAGTEIMTIADLENMEVQVDVNENDIIRLTLGDTAIIEVDAYISDTFEGIVTEIANSANVTGIGSDQITNFEVKIAVLKSSYNHLNTSGESLFCPFRPGMSATVDIKTEIKYNALSVPIQAVTTRTDSTGTVVAEEIVIEDSGNEEDVVVEGELKEVVFVYKDEEVTMIEVSTGIQDNIYIEIISGISSDDEVVVSPYSVISKKLKNNMKVKKVKKEELFNEE